MTTHALPERTADQRLEALCKANASRIERARFKTSLRRLTKAQAARMVVAMVERPPEWAVSWRCAELLRAVPLLGPVKVNQLMQRLAIYDGKRLGGLTGRQRRDLQEALVGPLRRGAPH